MWKFKVTTEKACKYHMVSLLESGQSWSMGRSKTTRRTEELESSKAFENKCQPLAYFLSSLISLG